MRDGGLHPRSSEDPQGSPDRAPISLHRASLPSLKAWGLCVRGQLAVPPAQKHPPAAPSPGLGPGSHVGSGCGRHARGVGVGHEGYQYSRGIQGGLCPAMPSMGSELAGDGRRLPTTHPIPLSWSGELLGMRGHSPDST